MPYATLRTTGAVDPNAGEATSWPMYTYMTTAAIKYSVISTDCRPTRAFGNSFGSFISLMNVRKAMCPAKAKTMLSVLENAGWKVVLTVAWTVDPGFSIPAAITVMKTAPTMEMKATIER